MKYIRQFLWILLTAFLGEILHAVIPFPIPASIYGLVLMLVFLKTGILAVENIRETAKFLLEIMPIMFLPAAVGVTTAWSRIYPVFVPIIVMTAVSTVAVMAVSGRVTQHFIRSSTRKQKSEEKLTQKNGL